MFANFRTFIGAAERQTIANAAHERNSPGECRKKKSCLTKLWAQRWNAVIAGKRCWCFGPRRLVLLVFSVLLEAVTKFAENRFWTIRKVNNMREFNCRISWKILLEKLCSQAFGTLGATVTLSRPIDERKLKARSSPKKSTFIYARIRQQPTSTHTHTHARTHRPTQRTAVCARVIVRVENINRHSFA